MDIIIEDPHELALVRKEELDKLFINGRGYDTGLKEHTRRCYGDESLRGMPERTRKEIKKRTKAALSLAKETVEFRHEFGLRDEEFQEDS